MYSKARYTVETLSSAIKKGLQPIGVANIGNIGLTATKDVITIYLDSPDIFNSMLDKTLEKLKDKSQLEGFFKHNLIYELIDAAFHKIGESYGSSFTDIVSDAEVEYVRRILVSSNGFKDVLKKHGAMKYAEDMYDFK